jgi:hypothetical protein
MIVLAELIKEKLKLLDKQLSVSIKLSHYETNTDLVSSIMSGISGEYEYIILYKEGSFVESDIEILIWKRIFVII